MSKNSATISPSGSMTWRERASCQLRDEVGPAGPRCSPGRRRRIASSLRQPTTCRFSGSARLPRSGRPALGLAEDPKQHRRRFGVERRGSGLDRYSDLEALPWVGMDRPSQAHVPVLLPVCVPFRRKLLQSSLHRKGGSARRRRPGRPQGATPGRDTDNHHGVHTLPWLDRPPSAGAHAGPRGRPGEWAAFLVRTSSAHVVHSGGWSGGGSRCGTYLGTNSGTEAGPHRALIKVPGFPRQHGITGYGQAGSATVAIPSRIEHMFYPWRHDSNRRADGA